MNNKKYIILFFLCLAACKVGPDYVRPAAEMPATFKEAKDWKQAQPKDDIVRNKWWEIFGDSELNKLEEQVDISNQNVKAAEAQFRQARALIAEARAGFFPTLSGTGGATRGTGGINTYLASLGATWEPDVWGRIRRTMEANEANAQANFADLQSAKLSAQALLATDYLSLRVADEQKRLLDQTVANYTRSLTLTKNLYAAGVDQLSDVMQAQVLLEQTQTQDIDIGIQRAQFEHAVAILIGKSPADFSIAAVSTVPPVPVIPLSVPSDLLERRPDVAASERLVAAANAQIGVTVAAFFPNITLSATGGFESTGLAQWFTIPARIWSLGPSVSETLFDAGLRSAQTEAAIAAYDQTVATYRQTVLNAFQGVEDNLAGLRILQQEAEAQDKAVKDAHTSTTIALNQYKAGTVSYLNVITAQTTEFNNEITAINIEKAHLSDAVALIAALGGGWDAKELDKPIVTTPETTPLSLLPPHISTPQASTPIPNSTPIPADGK